MGGMPTPRRTQAQRRATTEARLLDAAAELVAEGGVRAVTLAATGERAGYSRGIVTHQFGNRDGLLAALTADLQDRFTVPDAPARGLDRLLAFVDAYLRALAAHPRRTRVFLVLWAESLISEPALRPAFAERDARFAATLAGDLRDAIEDGDVDAGIDVEPLALALVGQLRGLGLQLLAGAEVEPVRAQVRGLLERGLRRA
jgi:AcrR family transcriptional regulator